MQKYQYYTVTKYYLSLRGAEKTVRSTFEINLLWLNSKFYRCYRRLGGKKFGSCCGVSYPHVIHRMWYDNFVSIPGKNRDSVRSGSDTENSDKVRKFESLQPVLDFQISRRCRKNWRREKRKELHMFTWVFTTTIHSHSIKTKNTSTARKCRFTLN